MIDKQAFDGYLALLSCIFNRTSPDQALHEYCGMPIRKPNILKEKVLRALKKYPHLKYSEIATLCGTTEDYVYRILHQIRKGLLSLDNV